MKNITLIIGIVLLSLNLAICLLFDSISVEIAIVTSVVILVSTLLSHVSSQLHSQNGFKISLPWTFLTIGTIQYVFAFLADNRVAKLSTLIILVLFAFELLLLIITYTISKSSNNNEQTT